MKNIKFILALLIIGLCMQLSFSQTFNLYLDSTAVWNGQGGYFDFVSWHLLYYKHTIDGDTVIDGKTYYKIHRTGIEIIIPESIPGDTDTVTINCYVGALREDSTKSFYMIFNYQTTEKLLYDFNLGIGDTLTQMSGITGCSQPITIENIDTVYLGSQPRKRFFLNNLFYFIEGIGASSGLFGGLCQAIESGYSLICFSQDNNLLIVDSTLTCDIISDINYFDYKSQNLSFIAYPNPFTNSTIIEFKNSKKEKHTFTLYKTTGQLVRKIDNISTGKIIIDRRNLTNGLYFFQLRNEREIVGYGKLIIE